jgi:hypothetical protein
MTKQEAKSLVKNHAPGKYRGSALLMLSHMVDASFVPGDKEVDAARERTINDSTLKRWVHIQEVQFHRVLKRFADDGLGKFSRKDGKLTYRLNLEPLKKLPAAKSKEDIKAKNLDRAAKARAAYAAQRSAHRTLVVGLVQQHEQDERISSMNMFEIVQHGIDLFQQAASA